MVWGVFTTFRYRVPLKDLHGMTRRRNQKILALSRENKKGTHNESNDRRAVLITDGWEHERVSQLKKSDRAHPHQMPPTHLRTRLCLHKPPACCTDSSATHINWVKTKNCTNSNNVMNSHGYTVQSTKFCRVHGPCSVTEIGRDKVGGELRKVGTHWSRKCLRRHGIGGNSMGAYKGLASELR